MLRQDADYVGFTQTATIKPDFFSSELCNSLADTTGPIQNELLETCKNQLYTQVGKVNISGEVIKTTSSLPAQTSSKINSLYTIFVPLDVEINTSHRTTFDEGFLFFYLFEQTYNQSCIFEDPGSDQKNGKKVKTDIEGVSNLFPEPQKETWHHTWYLYHVPKYLSRRLSLNDRISCKKGMLIKFESNYIYCTNNWSEQDVPSDFEHRDKLMKFNDEPKILPKFLSITYAMFYVEV